MTTIKGELGPRQLHTKQRSANCWSYWPLTLCIFSGNVQFGSPALSNSFNVRPPRRVLTLSWSWRQFLFDYTRLNFPCSSDSGRPTSESGDSAQRTETLALKYFASAGHIYKLCSRLVIGICDAHSYAILMRPSRLSLFAELFSNLYILRFH